MKQYRDMIKSVLVLNKYYFLRNKLHCANLHVFIWKEIVIYDRSDLPAISGSFHHSKVVQLFS